MPDRGFKFGNLNQQAGKDDGGLGRNLYQRGGVFPFMVHYSVDEGQQTVVVSAVFHTYRDPQEWEMR